MASGSVVQGQRSAKNWGELKRKAPLAIAKGGLLLKPAKLIIQDFS
jgi:hypothetical protein